MSLLFFLWLSAKRLRYQVSLALVLGLSSALAIGLVAAIPMFADAVSRRIMQQELGLAKEGKSHPIAVRIHASPSARFPLTIADAEALRPWLTNELNRLVGIPIYASYLEVHSPRFGLIPAYQLKKGRAEFIDGAYVIHAEGVGDHLRITAGAPFGAPSEGETLSVWLNQQVATDYGLQVGDSCELGDVYAEAQDRIPAKIAGLWEARDKRDEFWLYTEPLWSYEKVLLTGQADFERLVYPKVPSSTKFISWRFVLDERKLNLSRAEHYITGLAALGKAASERLPAGAMDQAPTSGLLRGQARKDILSLVLLGLAVPLMAIIVYSIIAVSAILVRYQTQEIATLTSRGSGRMQIMLLSLFETVVILAVATPAGLLLAKWLAELLGNSASFLRLTFRAPLEADIISTDWRLVGAAMLVTILARLAPTWPVAGLTIVQQERRSARQQYVLGAARLLAVGALALTTYYAYRRLAQVGSLALVSWKPTNVAYDPLLLLAPALFLLVVPLVIAELFLLLMPLLTWIGRTLPSVVVYLSCLNLGREGRHYRTPVYMLVLCLGLGVFFASLARSADSWLVERREYEIGADLTFRPRTAEAVEKASQTAKAKESALPSSGAADPELLANLLQQPISEYEGIPGVAAAMHVGQYKSSIVIGNSYAPGRLLAVDRLRFPRVAYFRPDYAAEPLGQMMNRLANKREALLVPDDVAQRYDLSEGTRVRMNIVFAAAQGGQQALQHTAEFVVVGTFHYFPTMFPQEGAVFIANLDYLQNESLEILPVGVWLRLAPGANGEEVREAVVRRAGLALEQVGDLPGLVSEDEARLERVGLFGILSISFVAGAILAALGLLVHSAAAMRSRGLRYAVWQALGLRRGQVLSIVLLEYALTVAYSVLWGTALGIVCSRLYVPFYQFIEMKGAPVPPYKVLIDNERGILLAVLMAVALFIVEGLVLWRLVRTRVFEMLRIGMRE